MSDEQTMREYYAQRVPTLEQIYAMPERQQDLSDIEQRLAALLAGHDVLELACGTGYWTERYAPFAASVLATDVNPPMLEVAKTKAYPEHRVQFQVADALQLPDGLQGKYNACFAGFLWSHIKRETQENLLRDWSKKTGAGTLLILTDNNYVEGKSTPIARTDAQGNTWQLRTQEDGSRVEIVKNFPTDSALKKKLGPAVRDLRVYRNTYYWMATCILK